MADYVVEVKLQNENNEFVNIHRTGRGTTINEACKDALVKLIDQADVEKGDVIRVIKVIEES